jgi:hypothetical protein
MKDKQQQLSQLLEDKQKNVETLREQDENKSFDLDDLLRQKQEVNLNRIKFNSNCLANNFYKFFQFEKNMEELLTKQRRLKLYDQVKQNKYSLLCKQLNQNEQELNKQLDKLRSLGTIITKLEEEYPNLQGIIRKVELSIQTRLNREEEGDKK